MFHSMSGSHSFVVMSPATSVVTFGVGVGSPQGLVGHSWSGAFGDLKLSRKREGGIDGGAMKLLFCPST